MEAASDWRGERALPDQRVEREVSILLEFPDERVAVRAAVLPAQAPRTCRAVLDHLPLEGVAQHAIYSGSEVYARWPETFVVERENGTARVIPGDVGYYFQPGGIDYGFPDDLCEICWFYDRDATPSMPSGHIQVNLFARMVGDTDPFFDVCRRMRIEGRKRIRIRRLETDASTGNAR